MHLAVGCDHVAVELKLALEETLTELGHTFEDFGTYDTERAAYPRYASKVCRAIQAGQAEAGLLICGTGLGMSITANKYKGIRAACVSEPYSAKMSREHNNANVLTMGARVVGVELARMILTEWLAAEYAGGRHQERLDMIADIETGEGDVR
jgi:ribose 5-phosphate isomerase B